MRVLIVGAGVTGSLCAHMLRRHFPTQLQCQIVVWEKSRGVGGRMSISRPPTTKTSEAGQQGSKSNNPTQGGDVAEGSKNTLVADSCAVAELGAQYITQFSKYATSHKALYDELVDSDVLHPLKGKIDSFRGEDAPNFISRNGLNAIAKHFFAKASATVCRNLHLESLRVTSEDTNSWSVWEAATANGRHDHFDAVILTMPVPQILNIEGVKGHLEEEQLADLEEVEYSSRFAVGLFYEPGSFNLDLPYVAKYVTASDAVRYIAIDNVKRGANGDWASIVVHTSGPFGKTHLEEDSTSVGPKILEELHHLIPDLPKPTHVKYHKWRYSQVLKPTKTYGCMVPRTKPLLVLAGDGFTHSNFDGCIESALKVNEVLEKWMKNKT